MTNKHEIGQDLLQAYVDGQLKEAEKERLVGHLKVCKECRSFVMQLEKLNEAMAPAEFPSDNEGYFKNFSSRVACGIAKRKMNHSKKPVWSILRWAAIPLAATATLAIAVVVSLTMLSRDETPNTFSKKADKSLVSTKDECRSAVENSLKKSRTIEPALLKESKLAVIPHNINEVTTIVIYLPGSNYPTPPPEISTAIEIDIPDGG